MIRTYQQTGYTAKLLLTITCIAIPFVTIYVAFGPASLIMLPIPLFYIVFRYGFMHTYQISIDVDSRIIKFSKKNLIGKKMEEIYNFSDISFSYKAENAGAKGKKKNVCVINSESKTIAVLTPGDEAWEDEVIRKLSANMVSIGIKRSIDKYNRYEVDL